MSLRPILTWPDPRLAQRCAPVEDVGALAGLVEDMFDTMYAAPGRGLAAPQVGVMQRIFVMDAGWKQGQKTPRACINPEILHASEHQRRGEEGCLSMPGVQIPVLRPGEVVLRYTMLDGQSVEAELAGFEAICAQHELDHLDGKMHFDRVDAATRQEILASYEAQ